MMKEVLEKFCEFTRMEVNQNKSGVVFSKLTRNREELEGLLGYAQTEFSINYLGLSLAWLKES